MVGTPLVTRRAALLGGLAVLAGCGGDPAPSPARLRIATGPPGAVFREIGAALASVLAARLPRTDVVAADTAASQENLRLLREGDADIAFASLDSVIGADGEPPPWARALGRVYDSHLHLVVLADSPVDDYSDLADLPVSLGAKESGTEFTVRRLLELTGLDAEVVQLDQATSARALADGEIDALFSLTGIPTPAVLDLVRDHHVRFIPLTDQAAALVDSAPGSYVPATIPATTYPGVPPSSTVAVPNLLLCRADLADDVAELVTGVVFTESRTIAADRPEAAHINVRTGIATGPVPLHPGSERWFRAAKK
ncbi:TAXI family TRAP transporter solute-binding subunit [Actinorugispora endophytica]|uniref:TRAP transporter TAXI family solute receptor n=1 Tax=Actinorugispora endophytica TaxID=1605990 RepID=A0A4R6V767_9ACTN|nr:TAXI family TRAP transporter solute-binding subunit [Actinorugispora endophytica]TDQ54946.1 hypothetical protein EV190_101265 [Actinorugispora endophytica]